jgi:isopentenyldiphosphate isomerase
MKEIPSDWLTELAVTRERLKNGDVATQDKLDAICKKWESRRECLRPGEKDELFDLVDSKGRPSNLTADRWLCHLLALRHRCAHVLLRWSGSGLGNVFVLQVRAWDKADSPGHLDISVGGHVKSGAGSDLTSTAEEEMREELGIEVNELKDGRLIPCGGYESYNERQEENFFNSEWREVYVADVTTETFTKIDFKDKEVIGLLLCPESEALSFLDQQKNKHLAVASALRGSLNRCLEGLSREGA